MPPKRSKTEAQPTASSTRPRRSTAPAEMPKPPQASTRGTAKKAAKQTRTATSKKRKDRSEPELADGEDDVADADAAAARPARKRKATPKSKVEAGVTEEKGPAALAGAPAATGEKTGAADERRDGSERCFWLMKAEPESRMERGVDVRFSIDDLRACTEPEAWDGVRNAVAQKNMKSMSAGDLAFFYHSNCKVPGIAGVMKIVREQSTDESAFDPGHPYYDAKSKRDSPRWIVVHVEFVKKFDELVPLKRLQGFAKAGEPLEDLQTLRQSRLSVSRVTREEWEFVLGLVGEDPGEIEELAKKSRS